MFGVVSCVEAMNDYKSSRRSRDPIVPESGSSPGALLDIEFVLEKLTPRAILRRIAVVSRQIGITPVFIPSQPASTSSAEGHAVQK